MQDIYYEFKHQIIKLSQTITGNSFLLAISGGVDSMVLLDLFIRLKKEFLFDFEVATVDHQLRAESKTEVEYIKNFCIQNNIKCHIGVWEKDSHPQNGTENAGRKFRYNYFLEVMNDENLHNLVLAHHGDDQLETVLMKLIRGGNLREVQAILPSRNFADNKMLVRPLLIFSKKDLYDYADSHGLKYFEDITNKEGFTIRNRIRNNLVPEIKKENPQALQHFSGFATQLQTANKIMEKYFAPYFINDFSLDLLSGNLENLKLLSYEENIIFWNIYKNRIKLFDLSERQIEQISAAVLSKKPNLEIYLDNNKVFIKNHSKFEIRELTKAKEINFELQLNQPLVIEDLDCSVIISDKLMNSNSITLISDHVPKKIILRTRQPGDMLILSDGHHQKLKKRMIDLKLSKIQKEKVWILEFDDKIVWVDGIYNSINYQSEKKHIYYLQIRGSYQ